LAVVIQPPVILTVTGNDFWHNHAQPHQWWEWVAFRSPVMLLDQGISAVYLFFVLSGFVLALPWFSGRHQTYPTFIIRRVCRIYIPYLASMLFSVLLLLAVGHPVISNVSTFYASIWQSALDLSTFGRTLVVETDNSLNFPTWTIAWELRIALIFPILLAPVVLLKRNGLLLSLVVMLVACIGLRVAGPVAAEFGRVAYAYIALFIMGAALASIIDRIQTFRPASTLLTTALLCLGALLLFPVWSTKPLVAFIPLGAGSMLVMIAALRTGWFSSFLQRATPRWLGKISFSVYLIHVPIITAVLAVTQQRLPVPIALTSGVILSFAAAPIFYRLVEYPAQQLGRRLSRSKPSGKILDRAVTV
jgi:peptidoglycan/LPS O-acetylase OafA/YrhL